jgi:hypothetical protein
MVELEKLRAEMLKRESEKLRMGNWKNKHVYCSAKEERY